MKNKIEENRILLQNNPESKVFPFPASIFDNILTTPRYKDTLIQAKISIDRTINFIDTAGMLIPEIDSKVGTIVNLHIESDTKNLNKARLAVNRFKILDKMKKKKLRTGDLSLRDRFSMNRMLKTLKRNEELPTSEEVWEVSLNSKYLNTITDAGSHMASFNHKSGNRCLTNYQGYFSMSSRELSNFYRKLYELFIKESVIFMKLKGDLK